MSFEQCLNVNNLMKGFSKDWFIGGGWAIDLFIGKQTREHHDIEICIGRKDQIYLKEYMRDWEFNKVTEGVLTTWQNDYLQLPIHEIHGKNNRTNMGLEILLNEIENDLWKFRRDEAITCSLNSLYSISNQGIPYLNPEIVLLYKIKNSRDKDHLDFYTVKDYLESSKKDWLKEAILRHDPNHKWLQELSF